MDLLVPGGEFVGELAGAVGAVVVGDEDMGRGTADRTRPTIGLMLPASL